MNRKVSMLLLTLLMLTTFSSNVYAKSNTVRDYSSSKSIEEINLNKVDEPEVKQKIQQLEDIQSQNTIISQSNETKLNDIGIKAKTYRTKPESHDIIKMKAIKAQFSKLKTEAKKLIALGETLNVEIDKYNTQNLANNEAITSLDKMIEIASQRNKLLQKIDKELDLLSFMLV